jgi:hypothetical protein
VTDGVRAPRWRACQRALAVADKVVVDVEACSGSPSGSVINIARQIADKVPI